MKQHDKKSLNILNTVAEKLITYTNQQKKRDQEMEINQLTN